MPPKTQDATDEASVDRAQTFLDWTRLNSRWLTVGAVVVAVVAAGYWFYTRSRQIQERNAETALNNARQAMSSGNLPLAQSEFQQLVAKYGSTPAGVQGAMLLAEMDYDAGKAQDGISVLEKVSGSSGASNLQPSVLALEADGYAQSGKLTVAGQRYMAAADATPYKIEKAYYQARAARAYTAGGDTAQARQIWSKLATDPDGQSMAAEARVRLGELTAKVATK